MSLSFTRILIAPLLTFTFVVALAQDDGVKPTNHRPARIIGEATKERPQSIPGGFNLPNGWRISPAGKTIDTYGDLTLDATTSPDGRIVIASHSGYLPHGLVVIDTKT
jgi:hypothetical protein